MAAGWPDDSYGDTGHYGESQHCNRRLSSQWSRPRFFGTPRTETPASPKYWSPNSVPRPNQCVPACSNRRRILDWARLSTHAIESFSVRGVTVRATRAIPKQGRIKMTIRLTARQDVEPHLGLSRYEVRAFGRSLLSRRSRGKPQASAESTDACSPPPLAATVERRSSSSSVVRRLTPVRLVRSAWPRLATPPANAPRDFIRLFDGLNLTGVEDRHIGDSTQDRMAPKHD